MFNCNDITPEMTNRFWAKVDRSAGPDSCWPFMGGRKAKGYGNFFAKRETPGQTGKLVFVNAHRFAYLVSKGLLGEGQVVRHKCDNPPCCNPDHLIPGTVANNTQDAVERGLWSPSRGARKALSGMRAYKKEHRLLAEHDIAAIIVAKAEGHPLYKLSVQYGMSEDTLYGVLQGHGYADNPLIQELIALRQQGIKFPYHGRYGVSGEIHPRLQAVVDAAARLYHRYVECEAKAAQTVCSLPDNFCSVDAPCTDHVPAAVAYLAPMGDRIARARKIAADFNADLFA